MANPIATGNLCQVRIWCVAEEQAAVNTVWYECAAAGLSPATDQDLCDTIDTLVAPLYQAWMSSATEYRGVEVMLVDPAPPYKPLFGPVIQNVNAGPGITGTKVLPRQVCGLIKYSTGRAGRAFRGRLFIPFSSDSNYATNGQVNATGIAALSAIAVALLGDPGVSIGGRTATLVRILHHRKNKEGLYPDPTPVTGGTISSSYATQRKRGSYGRPNSSPV